MNNSKRCKFLLEKSIDVYEGIKSEVAKSVDINIHMKSYNTYVLMDSESRIIAPCRSAIRSIAIAHCFYKHMIDDLHIFNWNTDSYVPNYEVCQTWKKMPLINDPVLVEGRGIIRVDKVIRFKKNYRWSVISKTVPYLFDIQLCNDRKEVLWKSINLK
ncbi:MAG: hypothetical protein SNJ71_01880 [Bacteroidales bacterium]